MKNLAKSCWRIFLFCVTIFGIYYSIYSHADNIYTDELSRLEKKIDWVIVQLDKSNNDSVWSKLPYIQNIHIPVKPDLFSPYSIYLSLFGQEELSGEHIYRINEIVQQNRDKLTGLTFQGLILGKQVKVTNNYIEEDHYNKKYPEPNFYLDFTDSNFSNTRFKKSIVSQLNFTNSNFQNSEYDDVIIVSSRFTNSNFSNTRINKSYFKNIILTDTEFNGSIMLNSSFESCDLHRSNFDKTSIINSSFLKTKLT